MTTNPQPDRRARYATAIRAAGDTAYGNSPFYEAITTAVIAVADAELAAVSVPASAPTDRSALSARLWAVAEHHIVAEWICCEPAVPGHDLCAKGYDALGMVKTLLVDADPEEAWNPNAPLLDAVLAVLPAPADRAAILREAANRLWALANRTTERGAGVLWAADWLRRVAGEAQQPETQAGVRCSAAVLLGSLHAPHEWQPQPGMPLVHCPGGLAADDGEA